MRSGRARALIGPVLIVGGLAPVLIGTGLAAEAGRSLRAHPTLTGSVGITATVVVLAIALVGAYWAGRWRFEPTAAVGTDPLTGLLLRDALWDALDRELGGPAGTPVAGLLLVDLDRMGEVNLMFGLERGDAVLASLAARVTAAVGSGDVVARLGGGQFGVLRPGRSSTDDLVELGERIIAAVTGPLDLDGFEVRVGAHVGVLQVTAELDVATARSRAEVARYRASRHGEGAVEVWSPRVDGEVSPAQLTAWVRPALERDELRLHHQPIFDLESGTAVATEALLRWAHPELGILSPAAMLRGLEDSGHIVAVGTWVIDDACRQIRRWADQSPDGRGPMVFVNISVRQLVAPGFVAGLERSLRAHDVAAGKLCFELGHLGELDPRSAAWATVRECRALGIRLAVDNFGQAASGFALLHRLPIDYLKLDRHLLASRCATPHEQALALGTIAMATELGCIVVAEGIEDAATLDRARAVGCQLGQGYHLGLPAAGDELTALFSVAEPAPV